MGQIKNIKLHIVTDIKITKSSSRWCTAKCGTPTLVVMDLAPGNVEFVQTNMESSANMDSCCVGSVSMNMQTISASRSSSRRGWTVSCCCMSEDGWCCAVACQKMDGEILLHMFMYHHDSAIVEKP